ncbi:MAG TPA: hypothetical protein VLZ75_08980 [Chitinophagales bacterium]|nr:hypothetical protein [Chitinophagales bacterium]
MANNKMEKIMDPRTGLMVDSVLPPGTKVKKPSIVDLHRMLGTSDATMNGRAMTTDDYEGVNLNTGEATFGSPEALLDYQNNKQSESNFNNGIEIVFLVGFLVLLILIVRIVNKKKK